MTAPPSAVLVCRYGHDARGPYVVVPPRDDAPGGSVRVDGRWQLPRAQAIELSLPVASVAITRVGAVLRVSSFCTQACGACGRSRSLRPKGAPHERVWSIASLGLVTPDGELLLGLRLCPLCARRWSTTEARAGLVRTTFDLGKRAN